MPLFEIQDEYIDSNLGRRVGKGEELDLDADRLSVLAAIGVRAVPIRNAPEVETESTPPAVEKAVKPDARKRRAKV